MINSLVHYALENGCLSVASESLLRQLVNMKIHSPSDLEALANLKVAFNSGQIQREACSTRILLDIGDNCEISVN